MVSIEEQFPWLFGLYYQLAIIVGVGGLGWLIYRIIRHRHNITQIIEERTKLIYIVLIAVYSIIGIYYVFFGQINYDEGTELYASHLVYTGKIPYIDFMYNHGPLLPYIYGIPQFLFGSSLYVGRLTSLFFGILMLPFIAKIAERFGGKIGGVVTLTLISFNPYAIYLLSYAKTYELTAFFIVLSLYFLFCKDSMGNRKYILSIFFMCLAGAVRQVAIVMLIMLIPYIVYVERKNVRALLLSVGTLIATLGILFIPLLILNKELVIYDLYWFNLDQPYVVAHDKVSNFLTIIDRFLVIPVLLFLGGLTVLFGKQRYSNQIKFLYLAIPIAFAVHFLPIETHPEHVVILMPVAAVVAGFGFSQIHTSAEDSYTKYLLLLTIIVMILLVLISNGPQWVDISGNKGPIQEVDEMATYIKNSTSKDGKLIAFSTYAAVQADRELLPGFSVAYFIYRPDWDDEKAREYHAINPNILNQYIESRNASAILLTNLEKALIIKNEPVRLIEENYDLVKTMGAWGQYADTVYLYMPKQAVISVQKSRVSYGDTQTWSAKLAPNADYVVTLAWPGTTLIVGKGVADVDGGARGSILIGTNIPAGVVSLRIELASNTSVDERTFIVGDTPGSIAVTVQESRVSYGDTQTWSATGFVPHEGYVVTLRSLTNPAVFVLASGNADSNGEASGSFLIGGNLPLGDNVLRIEVESLSSYFGEITFKIG